MVQNFQVSLQLTFPIFMYLGLGIFLNVLGLVRTSIVGIISKSVYWFFIPLLLFLNIYTSDLTQAFNAHILLIGLGFLALIVLISSILLMRLPIDSNQKAIYIQAVYRSNITLFTLPILGLFYSNDALASMSLFVVFLVPFFNLIAVIAFKRYSESSLNPIHILFEILKNPLIVASILGLVLNKLGIQLPLNLLHELSTLKEFSNPIALVSVGLMLNLTQFKKNQKQLIILSAFRLVIIPACALGFSIVFSLNSIETVGLILAFAAPSPSVVAQMADHYHSDVDLATQLIMSTVILSSLTLPLWITLFLQLHLI